MKIYTKTGDAGETALIGGKRVPKHHVRVETYGCVDELSAAIGWALVPCGDPELITSLRRIQEDLFVIGAELASGEDTPPPTRLDPDAVARLEEQLDRAWEQVPELRSFVLPGGSESAARLHLARTVCRRAERAVVALSLEQHIADGVLPYMNRLGDLLFAYARLVNQHDGVEETVWPTPEERA